MDNGAVDSTTSGNLTAGNFTKTNTQLATGLDNGAVASSTRVAIAVSDIIVSCSVWVVVVLVCLIIFGPLFFRHFLRPVRIRQLQRAIREGRRQLIHPDLQSNKAFVESIVNEPVYLSRSHHMALGLDMDKDGYSFRSAVAAERRKLSKDLNKNASS